MPLQFFQDTDDKVVGSAAAYERFMTFMRVNGIPLSGGIQSGTSDDIRDAISEVWDALAGDIPTLRADISGALNTNATDLEVALITWFILREKFQQYGATLPGGGGP